MKITRVELSEQDQEMIYQSLISKFKTDTEDQQEIEFKYLDATIGAELRLTIEGSELDENNQGHELVYVSDFELWIMIDGEEVEYTLSDVSYYSEITKRYRTRDAKTFLERLENLYQS